MSKGYSSALSPDELTVQQEEFFQDSKLRDEYGNLVICRHYTVHEFDEFDPSTIGLTSGDEGYFGKGFYFTAQKNFNSCCWPDKEKGEELKILQCYLNLRNPFYFEKLEDGEVDYNLEHPYSYDQDNFLEYLRNHSEDELAERIILDTDQFVEYLRNSYDLQSDAHYDEYLELAEKYENGEMGFYDKNENGVSLGWLYDNEEKEGNILTKYNCLDFSHIHHGRLSEYSQLITDYAKENEFDGIISDGTGAGAVEIVVFYPNQIKAIDNLYPTKDNNFKDNTEDYFKNNSNGGINMILKKDKNNAITTDENNVILKSSFVDITDNDAIQQQMNKEIRDDFYEYINREGNIFVLTEYYNPNCEKTEFDKENDFLDDWKEKNAVLEVVTAEFTYDDDFWFINVKDNLLLSNGDYYVEPFEFISDEYGGYFQGNTYFCRDRYDDCEIQEVYGRLEYIEPLQIPINEQQFSQDFDDFDRER